jgi:hypothetical protein
VTNLRRSGGICRRTCVRFLDEREELAVAARERLRIVRVRRAVARRDAERLGKPRVAARNRALVRALERRRAPRE